MVRGLSFAPRPCLTGYSPIMSEPSTPLNRFTRRDFFLRGIASSLILAGVSESDWMAAKAAAVVVSATPSQTEGPYFVDELLNRLDIRADPTTGAIASGFPLVLGVTISRISSGVITPISGAQVDLWHCNAAGLYSDVSANSTVGQKFLRGYQNTDAHGNVRFLTVYPGWYSGRTVHMHFKVRLYTGATKTLEFNSQLYFDDTLTSSIYTLSPYNTRSSRNTFNSNDGIYSSGGSQLQLRMASDGSYAVSSYHVMLNA
jgi:protocatechuate 3,4-dioxygenase beta subunit